MNEPELTAETIRDGVIYMSDLGFISEDGYLYLIGRRDDVINIGGFKVVLLKLRMWHKGLRESLSACIPYEDKMFGRCLKMLVVLKDNYCFDATAISDYMESKLEEFHKIPKIIDCVREIPKTFNGKIDRKRLIEMHS